MDGCDIVVGAAAVIALKETIRQVGTALSYAVLAVGAVIAIVAWRR